MTSKSQHKRLRVLGTTCQAAVYRNGELRHCKRRAVAGEFCAEHFELHARGLVWAWKCACWLEVPKWLFWLRWLA